MSDMVSMVIRLDFHASYRSVNIFFAFPNLKWAHPHKAPVYTMYVELQAKRFGRFQTINAQTHDSRFKACIAGATSVEVSLVAAIVSSLDR